VCVPDRTTAAASGRSPITATSIPAVRNQDANSAADVNGGRMNGFVGQAELKCKAASCNTDVMGHHVASDIPNYWSYAENFVLNDHMYESDHSWSLPSHMNMVSAWSANCSNPASR